MVAKGYHVHSTVFVSVQDTAGIGTEGAADEGDYAVEDGKSKPTRAVRMFGYCEAVLSRLGF